MLFSNTIMINIVNYRVGYIVEDANFDILTFSSAALPCKRGFTGLAIINIDLIEVIS